MPDAAAADYQTVLYRVSGATAWIAVNRPNAMNALNALAVAELSSAFQRARDDAVIKGVVLTGAGDHAFMAGADIIEIARATPIEAERSASAGQALMTLIEGLGKPVVAAVNGLALGGGCEAAMACNIRIASREAKFGQPEVKLGLIPGFGGSQRLPRLVGQGRALQLILTGDTISADEALRIGLVSDVVEAAELEACAERLLTRIYANAPLATRAAIDAVNGGLNVALPEGLLLERSLFALCAATDDKTEGTSAFLQKRQPLFKGV
jgi:enoyl-CoA hydratase/carnithine racemase